MKRIIGFIICLCVIFNICGCKKSTVNENEVLKKFNIEKTTKVVEAYMKASMKNDTSKMDALYSKDFAKKVQDKKPNNVIITGYMLQEVSQSGDMGIIKVRVTKTSSETSYAQLETDTFKVIKEGENYKIKDLDNINEKEVFVTQNQIRIRLKDKAKTLLVTNFRGMPKYYYAREDTAKSNMLKVSLEEYGNMALTYEGTVQAIATKGKNPLIEVVHYEEAMMTQGGTSGSQSSGDSGGGKPSGEVELAPEKPLAKENVPIDIISDGVINNMVFSENERLLAVQYTKNNLGTSIKVYKVKNGELIPFKFDKNYPMDKLDVTIDSFQKEALVYNVVAKEQFKNDDSIRNMVGKWELDVKKFNIKRSVE